MVNSPLIRPYSWGVALGGVARIPMTVRRTSLKNNFQDRKDECGQREYLFQGPSFFEDP